MAPQVLVQIKDFILSTHKEKLKTNPESFGHKGKQKQILAGFQP